MHSSGGATPRRARSNDLSGKSTALAPPCIFLCFGDSMNIKFKMLLYLPALFYFDSETISGVGGLCFEGVSFFEEKSAPQRKSWLRP